MVYSIPEDSISIGIQTIINDMGLMIVISLPIVLLRVALVKKSISDKYVFLSSLIMSVLYVSYITRDSITPFYVTPIVVICFFSCVDEIRLRSAGKVGSFKVLPDFLCCFIFLLCLCFISSVIGQASFQMKIKNIISINNDNYKLLRVYGDNLFVESEGGKVFWLRSDNKEFKTILNKKINKN